MSLVQEKPELKNKLALILEKKSEITKLSEEVKHNLIPFSLQSLPFNIGKMTQANHTTLEIGSGWGEFTLQSAERNPQEFIIALERKKSRVVHCLKEQNLRGMSNIRWLIVDVYWFFDELFLPKSFDKIIINFPDPWPKLRHQKHRYMNHAFLATLSNYAKVGCVLEFATDFWPYMSETLQLLEASELWQNQHGEGRVLRKIENRPISFFEQMKRDANESVYFLQFEKQK